MFLTGRRRPSREFGNSERDKSKRERENGGKEEKRFEEIRDEPKREGKEVVANFAEQAREIEADLDGEVLIEM